MTAPDTTREGLAKVVEDVAVALCRQDDTQFHHERTDDFPCWSCREKAEVVTQALHDHLTAALAAEREAALGEAASLVEGLRVHVDSDPNSACEDGCGFFNYAAMKVRELRAGGAS